MAAKLTRMTHKIAIQLHLVAKRYTIHSSHSKRPVHKLLVMPLYFKINNKIYFSLNLTDIVCTSFPLVLRLLNDATKKHERKFIRPAFS